VLNVIFGAADQKQQQKRGDGKQGTGGHDDAASTVQTV